MGTKATFPMNRISVDLSQFHGAIPVYDVLIVGSGYGGSIAASKLAAAAPGGKKLSVCLLERGQEILPGEYPTDLLSARAAMQLVTARAGRLQPDKNALMEVRVNDDVHVILGNGLGGGSLVNANVSIVPDPRVFDKGWPTPPKPVTAEGAESADATSWMTLLAGYYDEIKKGLGANPINRSLNKLTALKQSATAMKQPFELADINVTFTKGTNAFGFQQEACTMCGDCCSGCNYGAKNTLIMNYLPNAKRSGATIVTQAEVDTIVPSAIGWNVSVHDRTKSFSKDVKPVTISARTVILSAGALGSTEILMRSARVPNGLTVSKALGTRFSANGDVLGFGFAADLPQSAPPQPGAPPIPVQLYSIGAGDNPVNPDSPPQFMPGPCITGIIKVDMGEDMPLEAGLVIEDGTAPGPFSAIYPPFLFMQEVLQADPFAYPDSATRLQALQTLGTALNGGTDPSSLSYTGVMTQLQSYLLMSHDDSSGVLVLPAETGQPDDGDPPPLVQVSWPGAGSRAPYPNDNAKLAEAAGGIWADFIANPIWQEAFGRNVVSVHPLGGCPMADRDDTGVTDALCRVYKGNGKNCVYPNLLVCDGSVIPTSLGVNPLLTISAIAAMAIDKLVERLPQAGSGETPAPVIAPVQPQPTAAASNTETWSDVGGYIEDAASGAHLVSSACDLNEKFNANLELYGICVATFSAYTKKNPSAWTDFCNDLIYNASNLKGDMAPGFEQVSQVLKPLGAILKNAPPDTSPVQQFLQLFFTSIGDITPSLSFAESMRGAVSAQRADQGHAISDPYDIAAAIGAATGQTLVGNFTFHSQGRVKRDPKTKDIIPNVKDVDLGGTVLLTGADGKTKEYIVTNGKFDFLPPDPNLVETWCMKYRCELWEKDGPAASWTLTGTKYLSNRPGSFWWTDISTLYVDLAPLAAAGTSQSLQGIIRLDLQDLAAQSVTFMPDFDAPTLADLKARALRAAADGTFCSEISCTEETGLLPQAFRALLSYALENARDYPDDIWPLEFAQGLVKFYGGNLAGLFGQLILRAHGGFLSYMADFPAQDDPQVGSTLTVFPELKQVLDGWTFESHSVPTGFGFDVTLFHFAPTGGKTATKGPILIAPGMSTTSRSFALLTNDTPSLAQCLLAENYDVWLFDSRLSPPVDPTGTPQSGYTLDDVAAQDWPAAVNYVLANSPLTQGKADGTLQILAHCVGALTAQMALLGDHVSKEKIRQLVLMQFTVHPAANWFNVVKQEVGLAQYLVNGFPAALQNLIGGQLGSDPVSQQVRDYLKTGSPTLDLVSNIPPANPPPPDPSDPPVSDGPPDTFFNAATWSAPFGIDHMCLSPTCHRIYAAYGPVIAHKNVNEATHNALRQIFGKIATKPFEQLSLIMRHGKAVSADGKDIYLQHPERLDLPIHIISGTINQILLPESGYYTQQWLIEKNPTNPAKFTRRLIEGYAHNDCIIGKNAKADVFDGTEGLIAVLGEYGSPTG